MYGDYPPPASNTLPYKSTSPYSHYCILLYCSLAPQAFPMQARHYYPLPDSNTLPYRSISPYSLFHTPRHYSLVSPVSPMSARQHYLRPAPHKLSLKSRPENILLKHPMVRLFSAAVHTNLSRTQKKSTPFQNTAGKTTAVSLRLL